MKYEYMLHLWGGFFNKEYKAIHKKPEGYFWFNSAEARAKFLKEYRDIEEKGDFRHLAIDEREGYQTRLETIVRMNLIYKGKPYPFEYNFGFAYPKESADYMFMDGNYSCDCNLSSFLQSKYGNEIEELECGDTIEIENFTVSCVLPSNNNLDLTTENGSKLDGKSN